MRDELELLTPHYVATEHQVYVDHLYTAITEGHAKNIALAGQYGTGKSSVLLGLASSLKAKRGDLNLISVSLSTLDAEEAARRVEGVTKSGDVPPLTNLIQKEILKQLIYRKPPSQTPRSRFRRLQATRWPRVLMGSSLVGVLVWVAVHVGFGGGPITALDAAPWAAALVVTAASALYARRFSGRLAISEVKTTAGSLTLRDSGSWFDQYLDEITYFFDQSRCRVVIFEDLDRFNDAHIFETLRELNVLLNSMEQLQDNTGPIRFVYAARDSVFTREHRRKSRELASPGDVSSPAANRIKFFDLVIPMVPFVTPRTSRGHLIERLSETPGSINTEMMAVIDMVSHDITDMRLIVNIANEFRVFESIILGDGALEGLKPERLLAMVVYKNLYPHDFEKVMAGSSKLNRVYLAFRDAVQELGEQTAQRIQRIDTALAVRQLPQEACDLAGSKFVALWDVLTTARRDLRVAQAGTATFDTADPGARAFWQAVLESGTVVLKEYYNNVGVLTVDQLSAAGLDLDREAWMEGDEQSLAAERAMLVERQKLLAKATMAQLIHARDLRYGHDDASFVARVKSLMPKMGLARRLLQHGFIDEYFTLYSGRYHKTAINAAAQNFLMLVVHASDARPLFQYTFDDPTSDIPSLLREAGTGFLADERCLNVQLFDHLLSSDVEGDHSVAVIASGDETAREFLNVYLREGGQRDELARRLAATWPDFFTHLAASTELPSDFLLEWLNQGLTTVSEATPYETSAEVVAMIRENWSLLDTLASTQGRARHMASALQRMGIKAPSLKTVDESLRSELVLRDSYDITDENLRTIGGTGSLPALDEVDEVVADYLLSHLTDYAAILEADPTARSIRAHQALADLLPAIADESSDLTIEVLDCIVARAAEGSIDREVAPETLWPSLIRSNRLQPTAGNLIAYMKALPLEGLEAWASLDTLDSVEGVEELSPSESERLALAILATGRLSPEHRIHLVGDIPLEGLVAEQIGGPAVALIPALLKATIIPDDRETYFHVQSVGDSSTRTEFFEASQGFPGFINDVDVTAIDLEAIEASGSSAAATAVLTSQSALSQVQGHQVPYWTSFALDNEVAVVPAALEAMAGEVAEPDADRYVELLGRFAGRLDAEQLRRILDAIPGEYRDLGRSTVKLPHSAGPLVETILGLGWLGGRRREKDFIRAWPPAE